MKECNYCGEFQYCKDVYKSDGNTKGRVVFDLLKGDVRQLDTPIEGCVVFQASQRKVEVDV